MRQPTVYILGQEALSFSYVVVHLFPSWLFLGRNQMYCKCTVHVALPKRPVNYFKLDQQSTFISLINMKSHLLILKKKIHPPQTFPPSTFIDFLDFFHPPLLGYCSYVLVFSKKSHPQHLLQPPRLLILQLLQPLHIYSNLHV